MNKSSIEDLIIDDNIVPLICNPSSEPIKKLIAWLRSNGTLCVSAALVREYHGTAGSARSDNTWTAIMALLIKTKRWRMVSSSELNKIKFKKKQESKFLSCMRDRDHIKLVIASFRHWLITKDANLSRDVNNLPGIKAQAVDCPSKLSL